MKKLYLIFCFSLFTTIAASAQNSVAITGKVTDESGAPLKSATVFLSGSQKITACDAEGKFRLNAIEPGNYQLSVTMVGYFAYSQPVSVLGKSTNIDIKLTLKQTALKQVNIGGKDNFDDRFKIFREAFLGKTKNANACVIVNPRAINFRTEKGLLLADADDFLIIENPTLGYRIKYLLKSFGYNAKIDVTLYDGETNFEPMKGTSKMQKEWDKNQLKAYQGSFMHFLRSVYQNRALEEGFRLYSINTITKDRMGTADMEYNVPTVLFDTLVQAIDTSFVAFKFKKLLFMYYPQKALSAKDDMAYSKPVVKVRTVRPSMTIISLHANEAIIDKRGAHRDFRDFLIGGNLARYRVGDQLPFEYQPLLNTIASK